MMRPPSSRSKSSSGNGRSRKSKPAQAPSSGVEGLLELDYMTEPELEEFIDANSELGLTPQEIEFLFIRRRRLSVDRALRKGSEPSAGDDDELDDALLDAGAAPFKITVLGDEASAGKISMLEIFTLFPDVDSALDKDAALQNSEFLPFDVRRKTIHTLGDDGAPRNGQEVELWAPMCTKEFASLRPLYYPATDCFIIMFSIMQQPHLLDTIRHVWHREVTEHRERHNHREIPVLLVGNHAERRADGGEAASLVSAAEAIELAKSCEMLKYIEIQSYNPTHIHEVFRQAVLAITQAREANRQMQKEDYAEEFGREGRIFRSILTAPRPEGRFDPWARAFSVDAIPGLSYVVTWDGSVPDSKSRVYTGPLVLQPPYPYVIKCVALTRCKYRSKLGEFVVPDESPMARGHFDIIGNCLRLAPAPSASATKFYYSTDGSEPGPHSPTYDGAGVALGGNHGEGEQLTLIRVVAIEEGKLRSPTANFRLQNVLPAPHVSYSKHDHRLEIATKPGLQYRFSVDGSTPDYSSNLYTGPIVFSAPYPETVKVIALPNPVLPSAVVTMREGHSNHGKMASHHGERPGLHPGTMGRAGRNLTDR